MKYSVIIVTYNRINLLQECIECVLSQTRKFDEIVVVDNLSTDGTREYLKKNYTDSNKVRLIFNKKNLGGAGGFKKGLQNVSKDMDYVLLIDDDAMLSKDFLELINGNIDENIYAYSGTVKTEGIIDTSHRRILFDKIFMRKKDISKTRYTDEFFDYDLSTFCGLMVSTKIIDKIGLPKSEYFIWYDDTEYSLRIKKYSPIRNINKAVINHKTIKTSDDKLNWKSYYGYRNQIDTGKINSECIPMYLLYRYAYHIFRMLFFAIKLILEKDKEYNRFCIGLHKDVLFDSFVGRLGKNKKYLP